MHTQMYSTLLPLHAIVHWLVLIFMVYSLYRSFVGYTRHKPFTHIDNLFRHWTATLAHIQLMIGVILYSQSPITQYYWKQSQTSLHNIDITFFGLIHTLLMTIAIVLLTIGSAKAKRQQTDKEKFSTILIWFTIALIIIFIAIPWPFSPLANRPYLRTF